MLGVYRLILSLILCLGALQASAAFKPVDLPDGLVSFNASKPVKISRLNDHFVLLHFGIYSTSNADTVIQDLKTLALKYPTELAVIGIHAAKFYEPSALDDIRRTLQNEGIAYPVVVDENLAIWKRFQIYALPTVLLIAPGGEVIFRKPGEDILPYVNRILSKRIPQYKEKLSRTTTIESVAIKPPTTQNVSDQNISGDDDALNAENQKQSAIDITQAIENSDKAAFNFDFENFVGEKIRINREYSRHVKTIKITFGLPSKTHLLSTVKSYVRVFTKDGEMLGGLETPDPNVAIPIDQDVHGDRLFVEASFYYSREGGWGMFKGLLFEIPLTDYPKSEDIEFNYNVSM